MVGYEIPSELRGLYKHWQKHVDAGGERASVRAKEVFDSSLLKKIEKFASERMHVWHKRYNSQPQPYTKNKILQDYRFCNIYRELDRQTIEIHKLLKPLEKDFDVWLLNLFFCRFVCKSETIKEVGLLSYNDKNNKEVYEKLLKLPSPKYGSAYVFPISIIQRGKHPTRESFFCLYLPQIMKGVAKEISGFNNISVVGGVEKVVSILKFNFIFHTTEVLIDVAYQFPEYINLFDRFPIGPGSEPTMKRLGSAEPEETCLALVSHKMSSFPYLTYDSKPVLLSAENWEGIGCEFRKYTNLSQGSGRKRKYKGTNGVIV